MTEAASGPLQALLHLQEKDNAIDRLVHRREHVPAHAALADIQKRAAVLRPQLAEATELRDAAAQRQATLEAEIDAMAHRVAEINSRLYGSATVSPRDAQLMAEEVKHLNERRSGLEDTDLLVMEELEPLQKRLDELEANAQSLGNEAKTVQAQLVEAQSSIDVELEVARQERAELVSSVPDALIAEYERLRPTLGGVAVAPLVAGSCGGCHLALSPNELAQIRKAAADAVMTCDECGRILVRQ